MSSLQELTLEQLRARTAITFRRGGGSRPDVLLVDAGSERAVLKDYSQSDPWFRRLIGPMSVRREARALARLEGIPGVPRLIRTIGPHALLLQYVEGQAARGLPPGSLDRSYFADFYRLLERIHERGIAHCDLRSPGNVLVGADGKPCIVDFVAHFRQGRRWNRVTRWMFARFCEADRVAVARLKKRVAPALLTDEEKIGLARDRKTLLERGARFFGRTVRDLTRFFLTKRQPRN